MERRIFTLLRGASVMLIAVLIGASCRKQADQPAIVKASSQTQSSSSTADQAAYKIFDGRGVYIGYMLVSSYNDLGEAKITVEASPKIAQPGEYISVSVKDRDGNDFATLNDMGYVKDISGSGDRFYSETYPVENRETSSSMLYKELIIKKGYIIELKKKDDVIGKGSIE